MPTSFQDYYATLGVDKSATEKQIKSAFRKIARETHPDTHPGNPEAEKKFRAANEAYEVLGNSEKRKKYDELGPRWHEYEQWEKTGGQGTNPFAGFGSQTRSRTVSPDELEAMFGGSGFSDFFQTFFGGEMPASRERPRRGGDLEAATDISLEEAYRGTTRTVELHGDNGVRRVEVNIPKGIRDGARVRAKGQARPGTRGGGHGDLYIRVHVAPDPRFTRDGDDVRTTVDIPLAVAIAGGSVSVPTPSGKKVALTIPKATRNGANLRLRGQGMPRGSGDGYGDLIVKAFLQLPAPIPEELAEWAERSRT